MTTIEEAIKWMDLDKRCGGYGGHCLKCDEGLRRKFDTTDSETRNALAEILCSCTLEDFEKHQPLLWLVALLNTARYEQFVTGIAKLAPYSPERAWQIIRLSEHNKGNWCFVLEPYRKVQFKPRFHLHPTVAPMLLAATIRVGSETEDAIALLDYFGPVVALIPFCNRRCRSGGRRKRGEKRNEKQNGCDSKRSSELRTNNGRLSGRLARQSSRESKPMGQPRCCARFW